MKILLDRPTLSPQTFRAWRTGKTPVPSEAIYALGRLSQLTLSEVSRLVDLRLSDSDDPFDLEVLGVIRDGAARPPTWEQGPLSESLRHRRVPAMSHDRF